jgi:hypothetical protein
VTRKTLLTVQVSVDELRVIKAAACSRGMWMSQYVRSLLLRELVDLERK